MNQKFSELIKYNFETEFQQMDKKILKIENIAMSSRRQSTTNREETEESQKEEEVKPPKKSKKEKKKEKDASKFGLKVRFSKDDGEVII